MGNEKLTVDAFAEKIKAKYPQYKDVDNAELTQKIIKKYPQYSEQVQFDAPSAQDGGSQEAMPFVGGKFVTNLKDLAAPSTPVEEVVKTGLEIPKRGEYVTEEFMVSPKEGVALNEATIEETKPEMSQEMIDQAVKFYSQPSSLLSGSPRLQQAANAFMSAIGQGIASVPKSIGILAKKLDFANEYESKEAKDLATYKAGQYIDDLTKDLFPTSPEFQDEFLTTILPQGAGSMVSLLASAYVSPTAPVMVGSTSMGAPEYEAALEATGDPEKAFDAWKYNMLIGTTEAILPLHALSKIDKSTGGGIKKILAAGFKGSLIEGAQEAGSQMASNFTAQQIYDSTRSLYEGVPESFAAGVILGGFTNGAVDMLNTRLKEDLPVKEKVELEAARNILQKKADESKVNERKTDERSQQLQKDVVNPDVPPEAKEIILKEIETVKQEEKVKQDEAFNKEVEAEQKKVIEEKIEKLTESMEKVGEASKAAIQKQKDVLEGILKEPSVKSEIAATDTEIKEILETAKSETEGGKPLSTTSEKPTLEVAAEVTKPVVEQSEIFIDEISEEKANTEKIDVKKNKDGFSGDFLNDYELIGQGSEHTVYRSKDKSHVIRLAEPYSDKSDATYNKRVEDALLIDEIVGDGSLEVIGYYESANGTKNPIYKQSFQEGKPLSEQEVIAHLKSLGAVEIGDKYNKGYAIEHNGKTYKISDLTDNFFKDKNGKIVAIDAAIQEIKTPAAQEVEEKVTKPVKEVAKEKTGTQEFQDTMDEIYSEISKEETDKDKQARFKAELLKRGLPEQGAEGSSKLLVKALTDKNTALGVLDMANKNLRELWSKETGMDLPKSQKGTRQVIEEYFKNPEEAKNITDAAKGALALYDGDVLKLANGDQNYIYENVPEATPEIAQQIIGAAREKVKQGGGEKMLKTEKPQPEKKSIADIKAEQALNQRFNYGDKEGTMTRKEFMDKKLAEGATVEVKEVVATGNTAKLEQELEFLKRNAPFGNENHPQTKRYREVKKILDEGGIKKPEYKLREKSGGSWTITKTEYDYAQKTPSTTSKSKGLTVEEGTKVKPVEKTTKAKEAQTEAKETKVEVKAKPETLTKENLSKRKEAWEYDKKSYDEVANAKEEIKKPEKVIYKVSITSGQSQAALKKKGILSPSENLRGRMVRYVVGDTAAEALANAKEQAKGFEEYSKIGSPIKEIIPAHIEKRGKYGTEHPVIMNEVVSNHKEAVQSAIEEGKYQTAISEGRMTAQDAKAIIESAGLEVPKDISETAENRGSSKTEKIEPRKEVKGEEPKEGKVTFTFLGQRLTGTQQGDVIKGDDGKTYKVGEKMGQANDVKPIPKASASTQKIYDNIAGARPNNQTGRVPVSPLFGGKPKPISKILFDVTGKIKQRLLYGKPDSGRRKSFGTYNPGNSAIKIRFTGDLDTTAHELGHSIDDLFGVLTDLKTTPNLAVEVELGKFSPFGSKPPKGHPDPDMYKRAEGFAEWLRAYIVNPDVAKTEAPNLYALYESKVSAPYKKALNDFSIDIREWAGTTGRDMTLSNIEWKPSEAKGVIGKIFGESAPDNMFTISWADRLSTKFVNPLNAFNKAIEYAKGLKGVDELLPKDDPAILARTMLGSEDKLTNILTNGMLDARNRPLRGNKNLEWLLEPLDNTDAKTIEQDMKDTIAYMVAERTVELKDKLGKDIVTGIGAGIFKDVDVAQKTLDEFNNGDPNRLARIKEAASRYRELADDVLRYMVDKGRMSEETYQQIKDTNTQYVALQRILETSPEDPIEVFAGTSGALASKKEVVRTIKGSSRKIQNPYISLLDMIHKGVKEADRNETLLAFRNLLTESRDMYEGEPNRFADIGVIAKQGDKETIPIFVDGKVEYWKFQKDVYNALKNLDNDGYKLPIVLTAHAKILRWTVTHFPIFQMRNVIRDVQSRVTTSNENSWRNAFGVKDLIGDKEHWNEVARNGGLGAGHYYKDATHYYGLMEVAMHDMAKKKNIVIADPAVFKKGWEKYKDLLYLSEGVNRVAEYRAALRKAEAKGMDDYSARLYAAYKSRDMLDFALMGTWMRVINQLVPFSNAGVQGVRSELSRAAANPTGYSARIVALSIVPAIAMWLLNHRDDEDSEEYEELPSYQRDMFWNIKIGDNKWLAIPKPYGLSTLAGSAMDRTLSYLNGNDKALDGYAGSVAKLTIPFDESALAPGFQPIIEGVTNYDFFRDKYIVPPHEDALTMSLRNTDRASRLSKVLSKASGFYDQEGAIDPRKIDHFIKSQFSYYGGIAEKLSDIGGGENQFNIVDLGLFKESPAYNSKSVQEFIELSSKYGLNGTREYREFNRLAKDYFDAKGAKEKERTSKILIEYTKNELDDMKERGEAKSKKEKKPKLRVVEARD